MFREDPTPLEDLGLLLWNDVRQENRDQVAGHRMPTRVGCVGWLVQHGMDLRVGDERPRARKRLLGDLRDAIEGFHGLGEKSRCDREPGFFEPGRVQAVRESEYGDFLVSLSVGHLGRRPGCLELEKHGEFGTVGGRLDRWRWRQVPNKIHCRVGEEGLTGECEGTERQEGYRPEQDAGTGETSHC